MKLPFGDLPEFLGFSVGVLGVLWVAKQVLPDQAKEMIRI